MDDKKYFFLAGLPRSGNTLLSTILNQNPEINVSANSFICDILFHAITLQYHESFQNFPDENSLNDYTRSIFNSYYQNWTGKYIIDRGPWGTPQNLEALKYHYKDKIKIIVPVRSIVEIISSFVRSNPSHIKYDLEQEINCGFRFNDTYKSEVELKCEIITRPNNQLEKFLFSLKNLMKPENRNFLHLIEYDDLVFDTNKTINEIYDFLEIDRYEHNFNYISDFSVNGMKYHDERVHNCNLHSIRSKIKKAKYNVKEILPNHIIEYYSGREFWR